jgi:hypothetical protein
MQEGNSMRIDGSRFQAYPAVVLFAAALVCGSAASFAQNSDFNLAIHASDRGSASEIGLPAYPGAALAKGTDNDSSADLGFAYGDTHFRLVVAKYVTPGSPDKVLAFYRKALSQYGDVLECSHDKPVGALSRTRNGLTCSDQEDGSAASTGDADSSGHHDLRSGSPHQFRIVSIDESNPKSTRFVLVYVELPKDKPQEGKSK